MKKMQHTRKKIPMKMGDRIFHTINNVLFGLIAFACVYPFYYVFINSISDNQKVMGGLIFFYPEGIHFQNYIEMLHVKGLGMAAVNSVLRTILGTCAMLISTTVLGYLMTKKEFWHRKFWYRFLILTMYFSAGLIPGYLNIKRLGLMNNFLVYILPAFVAPYNMILVKTYIENIPSSLEEAAVVDGAGYFKRFIHIIIPLSEPIIATVAIFTAVGQWNSFMDTVLYMSGNNNQTLQSLLQLYLNRAELLARAMRQNANAINNIDVSKIANTTVLRNTMTMVTVIPVLLVYPFFQRYFTKGIMIGAVKG